MHVNYGSEEIKYIAYDPLACKLVEETIRMASEIGELKNENRNIRLGLLDKEKFKIQQEEIEDLKKKIQSLTHQLACAKGSKEFMGRIIEGLRKQIEEDSLKKNETKTNK